MSGHNHKAIGKLRSLYMGSASVKMKVLKKLRTLGWIDSRPGQGESYFGTGAVIDAGSAPMGMVFRIFPPS